MMPVVSTASPTAQRHSSDIGVDFLRHFEQYCCNMRSVAIIVLRYIRGAPYKIPIHDLAMEPRTVQRVVCRVETCVQCCYPDTIVG
jgi:hypothetical protein